MANNRARKGEDRGAALETASAHDYPRCEWQNFTMDAQPTFTRTARFYCPSRLSPGAVVDLPDQAAHHAMRVLRLAPDDRVRLFNGEGGEWAGAIRSISRSGVSVRITAHDPREAEARVRVVLAQGLSSRERMEILPLETRRSVVKLREERASRRVEHWQHLAIAACEQCGRNRVPAVHAVMGFADWLGTLPQEGPETRVMLSPGAKLALRELSAPAGVLLLVGPEGGLDPEEQETAATCGFRAVRLGPRILRTETAALAAVSAIHALWGDF
jgi:16S rRNA (uracil1498-N3)-methyltransferase